MVQIYKYFHEYINLCKKKTCSQKSNIKVRHKTTLLERKHNCDNGNSIRHEPLDETF